MIGFIDLQEMFVENNILNTVFNITIPTIITVVF